MLTIDTIPLCQDNEQLIVNNSETVHCPQPTVHLLIFLVYTVATAATAKFLKFKPIRRILFVFCRHVVAFFTLRALQNYVISRHFKIPYFRFQIPDQFEIWNLES